jgi:hypothetical protein
MNPTISVIVSFKLGAKIDLLAESSVLEEGHNEMTENILLFDYDFRMVRILIVRIGACCRNYFNLDGSCQYTAVLIFFDSSLKL